MPLHRRCRWGRAGFGGFESAAPLGYHSAVYQAVTYTGFWRRFAAAFIDGVILGAFSFVVGLVLGFSMAAAGVDSSSIELAGNLVGAVIGWLYGAMMESSPLQATLGKLALNIRVADMSGQRIGFGRATGRHFAKYISMITLFVGYIMAGCTEKKQALHDMIARTLVVDR